VRVIREESELALLRRGDVLICPITSPAWSPLFAQASAVVTDGGGVLAHAAVIAREYAIPAVLATGDATRRLRDGQIVTVDGTSGLVRVKGTAAGRGGPASGTGHSPAAIPDSGGPRRPQVTMPQSAGLSREVE
jgi:phosphohistidine swiveling domain-containing protein